MLECNLVWNDRVRYVLYCLLCNVTRTHTVRHRYGRLSQKLAATAAQPVSLAAAAAGQPAPVDTSALQSELAVLEDYLRE